MKPRALDLFSGAGGASMGLHRAGFDVTGIDIKSQPRYPFTFVQADALSPPFRLEDFDLVWASPPCQAYSALRHLYPERTYPDCIDATRRMLKSFDGPWVIENVPGSPLRDPTQLCGSWFSLRVRRHRWFESTFWFPPGWCVHRVQGRPIDVSGTGGRRINRRLNDHGGSTNKPRNISEARQSIGIHWMTRPELSQAIPPAYAEHIGRYAIMALEAQKVSA